MVELVAARQGSMLEENFIKIINRLYPEYKIYGPYPRKSDGRMQLVLSKGKLKITKLYAKFLMEVSLERILSKEETIDHINENPLDDTIENLQILTRQENSRKSSIGNKHSLGYKQTEEQKRSGVKNGQAKFSNEDVVFIRNALQNKLISIKELMEKYKVSRKTIYNISRNLTYKIN
jgi:transcriptional antiterminator